jgi:hypothetical protein
VSSTLRQLHGLHNGPRWARLESLRKTYAGRVPDGLLPIGTDPFGNVFCLGLGGAWRGKVWFWDHESEADEGEPPRVDNLSMVAASFTSFLAALRPQPVQPALPRSRSLQQAAFRGDLATVDRLLAAGADPNERGRGIDGTPLIAAAAFGHVEIVKRLLAKGADVHARDRHGHTAAVVASWADHRDVIRELMVAGARPETPALENLFAKWRKRRPKRRPIGFRASKT